MLFHFAAALVFALTGCLFLAVTLLLGKLLRPSTPDAAKGTVYECGEKPLGGGWFNYNPRFYIVALAFLIFDVEVAFFFPWAAVFGKATQLAADGAPVMASDLDPAAPADQLSSVAVARLRELGVADTSAVGREELQEAANSLAVASLADIAVFFGVLLVGFAYVWKRGDLDWVRAVTRQDVNPAHRPPPARALEPSQSILSA